MKEYINADTQYIFFQKLTCIGIILELLNICSDSEQGNSHLRITTRISQLFLEIFSSFLMILISQTETQRRTALP